MRLLLIKKSLLVFCFSFAAIFTLNSCEDTNQTSVEIKISPDIPLVGNFEFEAADETVSPNWFTFTLSFNNPTTQRLIIRSVTVSYKVGQQAEFSGETELDPYPTQTANYFLSVNAKASGEEYVHLGLSSSFTRYLFDLEADSVSPRNLNYYVKFVFAGYFTDDTSSTYPLPTEKYEKTILLRTKAKD